MSKKNSQKHVSFTTKLNIPSLSKYRIISAPKVPFIVKSQSTLALHQYQLYATYCIVSKDILFIYAEYTCQEQQTHDIVWSWDNNKFSQITIDTA